MEKVRKQKPLICITFEDKAMEVAQMEMKAPKVKKSKADRRKKKGDEEA